MLTQTRTCDSCQAIIPDKEYNFNAVVTIHIGHYDRAGKRLEFCTPCWDKTYDKHMIVPKEAPFVSIEQRTFNLLSEIIELVTPPQQ